MISNYREVFQNQREEMRGFLQHVFKRLDDKKFFSLVDSILQDKNLSDDEIYGELSRRIGEASLGKIWTPIAGLRSLWDLQRDISSEVHTLMGERKQVEGYTEIGYPGRMIRPIQKYIEIKGPITVVNTKESMSDYLQSGFPRPYHQFIPINDYTPLDAIPSESQELVTCFIGLHHIPKEKLEDFVQSIQRILKPGGSFILMDHDANNDQMKRLADVVHRVFNAATGVLPEEEKEEFRNFQSLDYWKQTVEKHGLKCITENPLIREGDSTRNSLIRFEKPAVSEEDIVKVSQKEKVRPQIRTYFTAAEWYNVKVSQAYGRFIEHTPFYRFPYLQEVKSFWNVFGNAWSAARKEHSFREIVFSEPVLTNLFIGTAMTMEYTIKAVCSAPIAYLSGTSSLKAPETAALLIRNYPAKEIDERIKVVRAYEEAGLTSIEIPRYKPFKEIACKLADQGVNFVNIAGQPKIQVDLQTDEKIVSAEGFRVLYEIAPPAGDGSRTVCLEVDVKHLGDVLRSFKKNKIEVGYIHDF